MKRCRRASRRSRSSERKDGSAGRESRISLPPRAPPPLFHLVKRGAASRIAVHACHLGASHIGARVLKEVRKSDTLSPDQSIHTLGEDTQGVADDTKTKSSSDSIASCCASPLFQYIHL